MNKERRKQINNVKTMLMNENQYKTALRELENILDKEEDAYDNIPENLQSSIRGEESEEAIDNLNEAIDMLDDYLNGNEDVDIIEVIDILDTIC